MIQLYSGEGKGKTTAAVGLAVRAAGAGRKVLFIQVIKDGQSSEIGMLGAIPKITVKNFGEGERIFPEAKNEKEKENVVMALEFVKKNLANFQLIIIDELLSALSLGLVSESEVIDLMGRFPATTELVLTGHGITEGLIKAADLVTEMKPVKHYYEKGIMARKGIEW